MTGSGVLAAELAQCLVEDRCAVAVGPPLADVREVGLVGLVLGRGRRVLTVLRRGEAALGAVPDVRDGRLGGEGRPGLVPVAAPEGDAMARCGLASLGFAHRAGADSAAADRVTTGHGFSSLRTSS